MAEPIPPIDVDVANADPQGDLDGDVAEVTWTNESTANDGYRVFVSKDDGQTWTQDSGDLAADAESYTTTNLVDGETYLITVEAFRDGNTVRDTNVIAHTGGYSSQSSPYKVRFSDASRGRVVVRDISIAANTDESIRKTSPYSVSGAEANRGHITIQ